MMTSMMRECLQLCTEKFKTNKGFKPVPHVCSVRKQGLDMRLNCLRHRSGYSKCFDI
jgi:hypothetical protein